MGVKLAISFAGGFFSLFQNANGFGVSA